MLTAFKLPALFFIAALFSTIIAADTLPVVDDQLRQQAQELYDLINQQIYPAITDNSSAMLQMNSNIKRGMTGTTGIAANVNSTAEQNLRNWTPTADDLTQMVQRGLQTGSLADRITYYNQKFPVPSVQQLSPDDPNSPASSYGVFAQVATNAAFSVADKGFNNAGEIAQQINLLYRQIDQQDTLKKGLDLNSAILLKIAALQADLMRIQAQQLKMQAVSQQQGNTQRHVMSGFIQDVK